MKDQLIGPLHFILFFLGSIGINYCLYRLFYGEFNLTHGECVSAIILFLCSIPIHEIIHGITCCCVSDNNWRTIKFGIDWRRFTFYCKYRNPIESPKDRIVVTLMPMIILAVIPCCLGLLFGSPCVVLFSSLSFGGASNDMCKAWKLLNMRNG